MAITEDQRHDLYQRLIEVLGREKATTLMEHLFPVGWADVATKRDLDHQSEVFRRDLEVEAVKLRNEMQAGFGRCEQQIHELRDEMQAGSGRCEQQIHELRDEMHGELATVRAETQSGFAAHDTQLGQLREELRLGLAEVRGSGQQDTAATRAEIAAVRVEVAGVEAGFERALREQTRLYLLGMITANAALAGLAFTFARLFGA